MKKILLLSDIPPNKQMTAGIYINDMARALPENSLVVFALLHPFLPEFEVSSDIGDVPYQAIKAPYQRGRVKKIFSWFGNVIGNFVSLISEFAIEKIAYPPILKQVVAFGREHQVEALWVVLQSPLSFSLAHRVATDLNIPLYTFIMDPPDWWLEHNQFDRVSSRRVMNEFEQSLRASETVGCVSWNMAEEYGDLYKVPTVVIPPSLSVSVKNPPAQQSNDDDSFTLGFSGNLYATFEWQSLVNALHSVDWTIDGRLIKVRLMGDINMLSRASTPNIPVNIELLGWRDRSEVIELLSQVDACYCPYRFGENHENETRLAFPSKLTAYLATGRPILFHGPKNSSPGKFLEKYDAAVICNSNDRDEILSTLEMLITDQTLYSQIAQNGTRAFTENLTSETQRNSVARFLDIKSDE